MIVQYAEKKNRKKITIIITREKRKKENKLSAKYIGSLALSLRYRAGDHNNKYNTVYSHSASTKSSIIKL